MNLKARIRRIENAIDPNVCPVCGADTSARPDLRALAEEHLAAFRQHVETDEEARALLSEDAPMLARALGVFVKPVGAHFCTHCGTDRRSAEELAQDAIARFVATGEVDEVGALQLLREIAPEWAAFVR